MNTKNRLVQCVGSLVLVAALMWIPVAAQAAPVQGGEAESGTNWVPVDWLAALGQLWNAVKVTVGLGSTNQPTPPDLTLPSAPGGSDTLTTEQVLTTGGDAVPAIDPAG